MIGLEYTTRFWCIKHVLTKVYRFNTMSPTPSGLDERALRTLTMTDVAVKSIAIGTSKE